MVFKSSHGSISEQFKGGPSYNKQEELAILLGSQLLQPQLEVSIGNPKTVSPLSLQLVQGIYLIFIV